MDARTDIHTQALEVVRAEIADIEAKLRRLKGVEAYHAEHVAQVALPAPTHPRVAPQSAPAVPAVPAVGEETTAPRAVALGPVAVGSKVHAALTVLRGNGHHPMATADIVVAAKGMGFDPDSPVTRSMHNAFFTAMDRRKDIFKKVGRGMWALAEWDDLPDMSFLDTLDLSEVDASKIGVETPE